MEFADKMKLLLKERGWNQKDFAREAEMDYTHSNKFFTGRKPNIEFLTTVKRLFPKADLNWLLMSQEGDAEISMVKEGETPYQLDKAIAYLDEVEDKIKKLRVVLTQK